MSVKLNNVKVKIDGQVFEHNKNWNKAIEQVKTNRELKRIMDTILSHFDWLGFRRYLMIKAVRR